MTYPRALLTVCLCLLLLPACSDPVAIPKPPKPAPPPPPLEMSQEEFAERFEGLALPVSLSRIKYLYKTPHERVALKDQETPALHVYRCRNGEMWVAFGEKEGRYGALRCQPGLPTDDERDAVLAEAEKAAVRVHEQNLRSALEQKRRRVAYVAKRLAENRDRILSLREEQVADAEKEWHVFAEAIKRHRSAERERLRKTCTVASAAAQKERELKHRNIRLETLYRDERRALELKLDRRGEDTDDKVRVVRQSMSHGTRELRGLVEDLERLRKQIKDMPAFEFPEPTEPPDETPFQDRVKAVRERLEGTEIPQLTEEDLKE